MNDINNPPVTMFDIIIIFDPQTGKEEKKIIPTYDTVYVEKPIEKPDKK